MIGYNRIMLGLQGMHSELLPVLSRSSKVEVDMISVSNLELGEVAHGQTLHQYSYKICDHWRQL